ncbi:hypothetical protein RIR_jg14295.t1 [Rhizophagus irregularis DAOM 181602=DAOM 197198]|nr:hypothetical protein RIR_jg14295.t1 [Rhizophagus irregularis DAOM 181602=DAOM 197198]
MVGRRFSCNADASDWLRVFLVDDNCESITQPLLEQISDISSNFKTCFLGMGTFHDLATRAQFGTENGTETENWFGSLEPSRST